MPRSSKWSIPSSSPTKIMQTETEARRRLRRTWLEICDYLQNEVFQEVYPHIYKTQAPAKCSRSWAL